MEDWTDDPERTRYGCFLPDLTGLARAPPVASLPCLNRVIQHGKDKRQYAVFLKNSAGFLNNRRLIPDLSTACPVSDKAQAIMTMTLSNQRPHNLYSHPSLDRMAVKRRDQQFYAKRLYAGKTRLVPVWRGKVFVERMPEGARDAASPVYISPQVEWWPEYAASAPILLGEASGLAEVGDVDAVTYFAIDLSQIPDPEAFGPLRDLGVFVDLRRAGPIMDGAEAALLAYAKGMTAWHRQHKFCGVCGGPTAMREAGFVRACLDPNCTENGPTLHHPRTDPAVIMLVSDGDRCLLGRGKNFPEGMYSTLAGFVEPGESLEDAVAREIHEEVNVRVGNIRYHSSQPWPFPGSIMVGFYAEAETTDITIDPNEIADAGWYERDWLLERQHAHDEDNPAPFTLSRPGSIARRLIDDWLFKKA